jgi:hypothetical protein
MEDEVCSATFPLSMADILFSIDKHDIGASITSARTLYNAMPRNPAGLAAVEAA